MQKHLPIILLLVLTAVIYISISFEPSIADDADAIHTQAAKEMLLRNDWVSLYVNGVRYLQKAPLLYWLVAIAYQVFGVNEFAVRFPTVLAIVLLGGITYIFGRWAYSQKAGLYAAAILVSCAGMFLFTRIMIPEALLTLLFAIAHLCFLRAFFGTGKEKRFYYGFYAATALALLTKGLIGIVFAVGPAFLFLLLTGNLSAWKELRLFSGFALFMAIAAPWHLLAGFQNENFFWFYFVNEQFLRFFSKRYPLDYGKVPFLNYWLLHLVWLFPWSAGFPLLVTQRFSLKAKADRQTQVNLYLWLWAGLILVFFNFSSSQEYYTFPIYPAIALLLGAAFVKAEEEGKPKKYLLWVNGILAAIALIFAAVLGALVWNARNVQPTGDLSSFLNQVSTQSEQYMLSLGHLFDLTPQAMAELRGPAIGAALVVGIGFPLAYWFRKRREHARTMTIMLITMGLLFICANRAHTHFDPVLSSRVLADEIMQRWEPGAKIVINGTYESGSSLAFYTNQPIFLLNGRILVMEFGSRYPDAPPIFLTDEDVRRLWRGSNRIFLFTENAKKEALLKNLALPVIPVAEKGGKSLLMNKP
jgi:4-amino-4-deoxy-L-arabinose transferase-like glycosyltransferase